MALRSIENLQTLRSRSRRERHASPATMPENDPTGRPRNLARSRRQRSASPFAIFEDPPATRPRTLNGRRRAIRPPRPFIRATTTTVSPCLADMVPSTTWGPFVETTDPANPTVAAHFTAATITSFADETLTAIGVIDTWRRFSLDNPRDPWAQYLAMALIRHAGYVQAFAQPFNNQATRMTPAHEHAYQEFRAEFEQAFVERMEDTTNITTTTIPLPSPPATAMQRLANLERQLTKHAFLAWPRLWELCNAENQRLFVELTALFGILEDVVGSPRRNGRDGWERGMSMVRTWINKVMLVDWIELGDVLALVDMEQEGDGEIISTARNDITRREKALEMARDYYEYLWRNGMGERLYREREERIRSLRLRLEKEKKDREDEDREKWRKVIMLR